MDWDHGIRKIYYRFLDYLESVEYNQLEHYSADSGREGRLAQAGEGDV
jgi:hypothetical protein